MYHDENPQCVLGLAIKGSMIVEHRDKRLRALFKKKQFEMLILPVIGRSTSHTRFCVYSVYKTQLCCSWTIIRQMSEENQY